MTLPEPFGYPATPHVRRHGPQGYQGHGDYKPWLRDEFAFRCVYCLEREAWSPDRTDSFSADHFEARAANPGRAGEYDNLVYACTRCNSVRRADPVPLDPDSVALADHLTVAADGRIIGRTAAGSALIHLLRLDLAPAVHNRRFARLLLRTKAAYPDDPVVDALYVAHFGYPADLPDLSKLRPPGGNSRPEGVAASHHARRARGELPEVY